MICFRGQKLLLRVLLWFLYIILYVVYNCYKKIYLLKWSVSWGFLLPVGDVGSLQLVGTEVVDGRDDAGIRHVDETVLLVHLPIHGAGLTSGLETPPWSSLRPGSLVLHSSHIYACVCGRRRVEFNTNYCKPAIQWFMTLEHITPCFLAGHMSQIKVAV